MEDSLNIIYNKLANKISSMIPDEWVKIYYLGEVKSEKMSCSSAFYFSIKGDESFIDSNDIPKKYNIPENDYNNSWVELCSILLELYDLFDINGQELWDQVLMSLNNSGSFSVDYKYDIFNENDGQVKRETIWAYETFGRIPREGTFSWELLQEYLQKEAESE